MTKILLIIIILFLHSYNITKAQIPTIEWQNTIGGSYSDYLHAIQQTTDKGYILGGTSSSGISGDKTEASKGRSDYWVVKLDETGSILWQNTIGGNSWDELYSIQQATDGGYILGGTSNSGIVGDKIEPSYGDCDYWVIKLDKKGNILWQNTIGGNDWDELHSIEQTTDGGYILGGQSRSGTSGAKTKASNGNYDCWIIKLNVVHSPQF